MIRGDIEKEIIEENSENPHKKQRQTQEWYHGQSPEESWSNVIVSYNKGYSVEDGVLMEIAIKQEKGLIIPFSRKDFQADDGKK